MAINRIKTGGITDNTIQSGDIAPGTIASDRIADDTIANAKLANKAITINGTSINLGASGEIVAGTDWQAVTVADGSTALALESGKGYFLDTNTGVIEATLPASPDRGDTIKLVDYSGTFSTNRLILNLRGHKIDSTEGTDLQVTTNNSVVELVYVDANKGWLVYLNQAAGSTPSTALTGFSSSYDNDPPTFVEATGGTVTTTGNFKVHAFTGDGNFVVSQAGSNHPTSAKVEYLVIAGGGSGGKYTQGIIFGSGGGHGGFRLSSGTLTGCYTTPPLGDCVSAIPVTATTFPITVGGGGSANSSGSNSVFATITSAGGGHGSGAGQSGAAGGGGGGSEAGNTPPVSPPQGFPAGTGAGGPPGARGAEVGILATGGVAGSGSPSCFPSGKRYYAGAGQGGPGQPGSAAPEGGGGRGGGGGSPDAGSAGIANTGGGGGGGGRGAFPGTINGSAGGKGVVILRYRFQLE